MVVRGNFAYFRTEIQQKIDFEHHLYVNEGLMTFEFWNKEMFDI